MQLGEMMNIWKGVYAERLYLFVALGVALLFYVANVLVLNYRSVFAFTDTLGFLGTLVFASTYLLGYYHTVEWHSFVSILLLSGAFGMFFSLLAFKVHANTSSDMHKKYGFFASIGVFIGALAPGCAACGVGLLSLLGLGTVAINFLPFHGLELSVLSLGIMSYSITSLTKGLKGCSVCQIQLTNSSLKRVERRTTT